MDYDDLEVGFDRKYYDLIFKAKEDILYIIYIYK